jgi:hypothetical protein
MFGGSSAADFMRKGNLAIICGLHGATIHSAKIGSHLQVRLEKAGIEQMRTNFASPFFNIHKRIL